MKINKIFLTTTIALFLVASCSESRLEEMAQDQFPIETAILSEKDMSLVVNGIYDEFSTSTCFGADALIFGDLISDNSFISKAADDTRYKTTGELNWNGELSDFAVLDGLYNGIINANLVINNTNLEETNNVLNYKGEAKIARGLAYFYAVSYYSPDPKAGVNQEFGVPLNLGLYDPQIKLPRATVAEVYQQIIKDLTEAIDMMTNLDPVDKGHLSPIAAKLLLSKVYLTRGQAGDYEKSIDYANQVIAGGNSFQSIDKTKYVKYFNSSFRKESENQLETIWEINMNDNPSENPGINLALSSLYAFDGAKRRLLFVKDFYDSFPTTDVRRSLLSNGGASTLDTPRGYWTKKYVKTMYSGEVGDYSKPEPYSQNVKVLRMSEAFLNKIEALYKIGNTSQALTELNAFAISRGGSTYTTATIDNILKERRKEFFSEGQRFFDLKRNNLGFTKSSNCYSVVCTVDANSRLFVFPMGLREMNSNPKMTQYPGY